jgi:hypothetical protein
MRVIDWGGVSLLTSWLLGWLRITMGIMGGGEETPLSAGRPRGKGVPPSWALDISGSPHLIIGYLRRGSVPVTSVRRFGNQAVSLEVGMEN